MLRTYLLTIHAHIPCLQVRSLSPCCGSARKYIFFGTGSKCGPRSSRRANSSSPSCFLCPLRRPISALLAHACFPLYVSRRCERPPNFSVGVCLSCHPWRQGCLYVCPARLPRNLQVYRWSLLGWDEFMIHLACYVCCGCILACKQVILGNMMVLLMEI